MVAKAKKASKPTKKSAVKPKTMKAKSASRSTSKASSKSVSTTSIKKIPQIKEPLSKSHIIAMLADMTGVERKQITSVIEGLYGLIRGSIQKNGVGEFTFPKLMKVLIVRKPATKARKGINPFTGEETVFKAKPARNVIRVRPLKMMKDMVL